MAISPDKAQQTHDEEKKAKIQTQLLLTMEQIIDNLLKENPKGITWTYNIRTPCNEETFKALRDLYKNVGWDVQINTHIGSLWTIQISKPSSENFFGYQR